MNQSQHLVLLALLGVAAIVVAGPLLSDKQNNNDSEKPLKEKSGIPGNVATIDSSEMPTKIEEKGVISVIQATADKLGSILGNKKKHSTTPTPYKGDTDPKSLDEAHQALKIYLAEEETEVNLDSSSSLPTNPDSDVSGKIGLGGLLGGAVATGLQAGSAVSETTGNVVDKKVAGLGNLLGSVPPVNNAVSAAGSHAAKKMDVDGKIGVGGVIEQSVGSVLHTGAKHVADEKVAGLGNLLGSAPSSSAVAHSQTIAA